MIEIKRYQRPQRTPVNETIPNAQKANEEIEYFMKYALEAGYDFITVEEVEDDGYLPDDTCNKCGGHEFVYFKKVTAAGNIMHESKCVNCSASARCLKKTRNAKKRKHNGGWRWKALQRTGGKCQICGSTENINVHHIIPVCVAPQFVDNDGNAAVVCKRCHDMIHRCDDWSRAYDKHI